MCGCSWSGGGAWALPLCTFSPRLSVKGTRSSSRHAGCECFRSSARGKVVMVVCVWYCWTLNLLLLYFFSCRFIFIIYASIQIAGYCKRVQGMCWLTSWKLHAVGTKGKSPLHSDNSFLLLLLLVLLLNLLRCSSGSCVNAPIPNCLVEMVETVYFLLWQLFLVRCITDFCCLKRLPLYIFYFD